MTLKEKFKKEGFSNFEYLSNVAEDFAIGFAEWFIDSEGKPKGEWSIKELLEIYKKHYDTKRKS